MGEDKLAALVQESLAAATRTGAAKPSDFSRIIVEAIERVKDGSITKYVYDPTQPALVRTKQ